MLDLEHADSLVRMAHKDFINAEISTPLNPIPGAAAMVGNGNDMQCFGGDSVHN